MKPQNSKARTPTRPNIRLRAQREQRHWTQTELARRLGTTYLSVCRWENGTTSPSLYYRKRLCELFAMSPQELGIIPFASDAQPESAQSVQDDQTSLTELLASALTQNAPPEPVARSSFLPVPLTSFIGREQETREVCALLSQTRVRLLTLLGPGGVGKTRLAIQVATQLGSDFCAGVFFISLASISDPALVLPTLAATLGLRVSETSAASEQVQGYIQNKQLLLVLDNLEHVLQAAPQLEQLLVACPGVKLLVTSRSVLHIQGEQEFPLLPLALPDLKASLTKEQLAQYAAITLFVQRAQAVLPTFQLTTENASTIAAICVRLDGLPLAIELAAARVKLLPPETLLKRLSQRLPVLVSRGQNVPERQQTLRGTLQWSYDLLSPAEQWLFRHSSVFVAGYTLEALEVICQGRWDETNDLLSTLSSLLDHSLIQQTNQQTPRLRMLETIREYGWSCLIENGEAEASQRQHALYYLSLAEEAAPYLQSRTQQHQWLERLVAEQENLRAALAFLHEQQAAELSVRLCVALHWYWVTRGAFSEGRSALEAALALPQTLEVQPAIRARALCIVGDLAQRQGSYANARVFLEESVAYYRELDDKPALAEALRNLGLVHAYLHHFTTARPYIEQSIELGRELADKRLLGHALDSLARLLWKQGDLQATRTLCEELLQLYATGEEVRARISPRKQLASIALVEGDYTRATILAKELLTLARTVGDQETHFHALFTLGDIARSQSAEQQAHDFYQQGLTIAQATAERRNNSMVLSRLGDLAVRREQYAEAVAHYTESLALARTFEDTTVVGWSLLGLARIAKVKSQNWQAAALLGTAEKHLNLSIDLDLVERTNYERDQAALQAQLGAEEYAVARNEGHKLTAEQALATLAHNLDE